MPILQSASDDNVIVLDPQFEECWIAYDRKGSKAKAKTYWSQLARKDRDAIQAIIPAYVSSIDQERYKKDFDGWINPKNRLWERKIIAKANAQKSPADRMVEMDKYLFDKAVAQGDLETQRSLKLKYSDYDAWRKYLRSGIFPDDQNQIAI